MFLYTEILIQQAYRICTQQDMVPEMVFLLGKMGDNKQALNLIIERLGDVNRVCAICTRFPYHTF